MDEAHSLAQLIDQSQKIVVFTGAGISTESGIADYRSQGGIWERYNPVRYQEFLESQEKRIEYWQQKMELYKSFESAQPNCGHFAIAKIHTIGKLKGVITQNIDGLHQLSGVPEEKIIELHGTSRTTVCLRCEDSQNWERVYERLKEGDPAPVCERCGGILKPNTISFGQPLVPYTLDMSLVWVKDCDLVLSIGSTLIVEPAASLPRVAQQHGAKLVIITLSQTPLDEVCDLKVSTKIGEFLKEVIQICFTP